MQKDQSKSSIVKLGVTGAKRENHDELLDLMRTVISKHPGISQSEAVNLWLTEIRKEKTLREAAERYAGYNIFRRLVARTINTAEISAARDQVKSIIVSNIMLWNWKVPGTNGKKLADCTFGEIRDAAPLAGKFLAKLSSCGSPETLVRDVFKNDKALQDFWLKSQERDN